MSLNNSIVEDAALEWFGELGYVIGHGPHIAPGETATERESFGVVVLTVRVRKALHPLVSFPRQSRAPVTPCSTLLPKLLGLELSATRSTAN